MPNIHMILYFAHCYLLTLAAVFLGLAALVASAAAWPQPDMPEIEGVEITGHSLKHHRTHHYRMENGHVIRRMCQLGSVVTAPNATLSF